MIGDFGSKPPPNRDASGLSSIETTLWNWAFTSQARASRCKHCFSLFHQSKDCEFAPNLTSSLHDPPPYQASGRRRFLCRQWNEQYAEGCSFPNCRYEHACYYCTFNPAAKDSNHKAIFCPNPPAQRSVTQQKPRPLFP